MTILFSVATHQLIVMTADSAVLDEYQDHREYKQARKYCCYEGVGCVMTWGARVGNKIEEHLSRQGISASKDSVAELADSVMTFLMSEYKADNPESDDIGYHVAGFDRKQQPCLYHIFWGTPRPNPQKLQAEYHLHDHSPNRDKPIQLLYNGRDDIAHKLVNMLISEIEAGKDVGFDIHTPVGLARLGDFVARYAAELTPEVGPPFTTILISPQNRIERLTNCSFSPLDQEKLSLAARILGVAGVLPTNETKCQIEASQPVALDPSEYTGGTITALSPYSYRPMIQQQGLISRFSVE